MIDKFLTGLYFCRLLIFFIYFLHKYYHIIFKKTSKSTKKFSNIVDNQIKLYYNKYK